MSACGWWALRVSIVFFVCTIVAVPATDHYRNYNNGRKKKNVTVAGFVPLTGKGAGLGGRGILQAIQLAVDHINHRSNVLPNHYLNIVINDTKVSSLSAQPICKGESVIHSEEL